MLWLRRWHFLSLLGFLAIVSAATLGQQIDFSTLSHDSSFKSIEQRLLHHDVAHTKTDLLEALLKGDFEVRWLAAYELVHVYGKEAIPDVLAALEAEKDPLPRESMADTLAQAGEAKGVQALRTMCDDEALESYWRVKAAYDLLNLKNQTCLNAVASVLQAEAHGVTGSYALTFALSMLPLFRDLTPDDSHKLVTAAAELLMHSDVLVRTAAAQALSGMGDPSAIPFLENAAAAEPDPVAAAELQSSLQRLQHKR